MTTRDELFMHYTDDELVSARRFWSFDPVGETSKAIIKRINEEWAYRSRSQMIETEIFSGTTRDQFVTDYINRYLTYSKWELRATICMWQDVINKTQSTNKIQRCLARIEAARNVLENCYYHTIYN